MRRNWLRFVRQALGPSVLASFLLAAHSSQAQAPSTETDSPARFIPNENLATYVEFDGLDAHAEGWRKTAAYRLLNETTTGAMLEELFTQTYARFAPPDLPASDALQLVKHCARSGFVFGANVWKPEGAPQKGFSVLVIRKGFSNKEVRPIFARLLQNLPNAGTKAQSVVKSGHKVITGKRKGGETYLWWVEENKKEDLILAIGSEGMDEYVMQTLDGKKPSALSNEYRNEVARPRDGIERTGFLLLDSTVFRRLDPNVGLPKTFDQLNLSRFDFSGGFQGEALATVSRFHPKSSDSKGDKPVAGFDKATIPGLPPGVLAFTVLALDLKALPARIHKIHQWSDQYDQLVATLKQKTKVQFEEDVLGQLGPKITAYVAPSKSGATPGSMLPNALGLLTKIGGPGADAIPKVAVLIDVANPAVFNRTLDEIMGYVNRQIKARYAAPTGMANEAAPPPDRGGRGRGPAAPPSPEFRVMAGETRSYVFTVPPELSNTIPAGFRPTIRVGPKQVAIAASADVARMALEAKSAYVAPSEIAAAFGKLPSKMSWLMVLDPRDSTPEVLASLPAKLQAGINTAISPAAAPGPAAAASPAAGSASSSGMNRKLMMVPGGASAGGPATPPPGAAPGSATATPKGALIFQVDSSKLPSVEDTKKLLFPSIYMMDEEAGAIRFTTREAFPPIPDPSILGLLARTVRIRLNPAANVPTDSATTDPAAPSAPAATSPASRSEGRSSGMARPRPGAARGPNTP